MQLELAALPGGPGVDEEHLSLSLDAVAACHDRNKPVDSSIMSFWPQIFNETTGVWYQDQTNMGAALDIQKATVNSVATLLHDLGLNNASEYLRVISSDM